MRSRILHPKFFQNQELAEMGPWGRILFTGLWCMADRAGRLKDCPQLMKALIFPYDEISVAEINNLLEKMDGNLINRYSLNGAGRFIELPKFSKYQHIHPHEAKSEIPANTLIQRCDDNVITMSGNVITMSGTSTSTSTSTSNPPIVPLTGDAEQEKIRLEKIEAKEKAEAMKKKFAEEIVSLWNQIVFAKWGHYQAYGATKERMRMIHARMVEDKQREELSWWENYFRRIANSEIMEKAYFSDKRWGDLTWCLYPGNMTKILEGRYDNGSSVSQWERQ